MKPTFIIHYKASAIACPIFQGAHVLDKFASYFPLESYSKIALLVDKTSDLLYSSTVLAQLPKNTLKICLPTGETSKNIDSAIAIWQKLQEAGFDRKSLLINLGGGVICDLGGFAASCFMRGIDFVNIPTTLLAQVDASVGSKTGIDFAGVKNLIGTFVVPKAVFIDLVFLKNLPKSLVSAGMAEVIKHGVIYDAKYFHFLETLELSSINEKAWEQIVAGSIRIKKAITEADQNETGLRKILNFGHTVGHALEALSLESQSPLSHGEAVALGMVAEAKLSELSGKLSKQDLTVLENLVIKFGLPYRAKNLHLEEILLRLKFDKKNSHNIVKMICLMGLGSAHYDFIPDANLLQKAIEYILI